MGDSGFVVILSAPAGSGGIPRLQHRETWGTQGLWSYWHPPRGVEVSHVSNTGRHGAPRVWGRTDIPPAWLRYPTPPTPGVLGHPGFGADLQPPPRAGGLPGLHHPHT